MPITALIVDDEPLARKRMHKLLRGLDDVTVVGEAAGGEEALREIGERHPEVVFLDVQMPRLDGFEVVRRLAPDARPLIVFVTAYEQYALAAFRASAVQYLLKPIEREPLRRAMARVRELVAARSYPPLTEFLARLQQQTAFMQHIAVKSKGRVRLVRVEQIDWFESAGNYVRLHVGSERFLLRQTMNGLEQKLDPRQFVRIHRTTIVNLGRIRDTRSASHGDHIVVLHDGTELLLSRAYRERLAPRDLS
ncbi:MAG TPA: LytTR family DNA-binding domain-containing protein [Thermoanaerobaculia bacterium]|jgi:two-component system LytT family response regulator